MDKRLLTAAAVALMAGAALAGTYAASAASPAGSSATSAPVPSGGKNGTTVEFAPDTVTVLRNPLNGWAMYLARNWDESFWTTQHYDSMPTSEGTTVRVSDRSSTAYIRTSWAAFEPEEGVYTWRDTTSRLYRLLKSCTDRGLRLALRVVVDGRDQGQNTPMYVIDAGAEYYSSGKSVHKSPFPDDPVFQEKYAKFIKELAKDFNDPDKMDFIDAFGLGKWGESHAMEYKDSTTANRRKVVEWITDLYSENFDKVPLVIHYHRMLAGTNQYSWGPVPPDAEDLLQIALKKGYILRHDAFGMHEYYQDWERNIAAKYRYKLPIIMEGGWITAAHHRYWIDPSGKYRQGHSEDVRRGEYEVSKEEHVNMMDFRVNDETRSWFGDCFDLVKKFNAEGGYRLYPDSVTVPEKVSKGAEITVDHRWVNLGWGYCPNNIKPWNYKYKPAFALLDDDGTPVAVFVDTDAEPSEWIQGSPTSYEYTFSLNGVPSGKYTWAVGIVDTTKVNGDGIPSVGIQIAVDRTLVTPDGWARIAPVKVR